MTERVDPRLEVSAAITEIDERWSPPAEPVELAGVRWLPDLVHTDGRLLHITFEETSSPWLRRLRAAREAGYSLNVACLPAAVRLGTLGSIQAVDGRPMLVDRTDAGVLSVHEYGSVGDLVALEELALGPDGLQALAEPMLDRALAESNAYNKGIYFEQVLCMSFSQVSYLRVISHRYVNETEEVDLVLGNRAVGELQGIIGGPLVLVSGKNHSATDPRRQVSRRGDGLCGLPRGRRAREHYAAAGAARSRMDAPRR